ncbi:MAG: putative GrpE heat shock protein [Acidimicrobiales bacterium]|nr:putative GrpE heat shock protein [Acidimicrobiales bacterium]
MTVHDTPSTEAEGSSEQDPGEPGEPGEEEQAQHPSAELDERMRRVLADLDNLRKRFEREVARERDEERARTTAAWLPLVDDLERALGHGADEAGPVVEGVRAVHEHALALLERLGYPRFDDVGVAFDPVRHEAVSAIEADAPPGTVVATVRPGYGHDGQVLRPAAVVVSKR